MASPNPPTTRNDSVGNNSIYASETETVEQRKRFAGNDPLLRHLDEFLLHCTDARLKGDVGGCVHELLDKGQTAAGLAEAVVRCRDWMVKHEKVRFGKSKEAEQLRAKWYWCTETKAQLQRFAAWNLRIIFTQLWADVEKVYGLE
ncbi:hypothetical protein LTR37_007233 [Vermiconidia calcicola]|uniref:Uncharacterized protein n=1 Tax=Vermiconidia calcicola TaxID=1690605 RepID=A0ACC3NEV2_9PEZI|nr:hypothetical protein LTR37_007233 [Vermiconidia calcicola]